MKKSAPKTRMIHFVLLQLIRKNDRIPAPRLRRLFDLLPKDLKETFGFEISAIGLQEILRQLQMAQFIQLNYVANYNEISLTKAGMEYLNQANQLLSSLLQPISSKSSASNATTNAKPAEPFSISDFETHVSMIVKNNVHQILERPYDEVQLIKTMVKEISELLPDFSD